MKPYFKQLYFDEESFIVHYHQSVHNQRFNANLVKYIPPRHYLFSIRTHMSYRHTMVQNPYLMEYSEIGEKFFSHIPAKLNEKVAYLDFAKYYKNDIEAPDLSDQAFHMLCGFTDTFVHSFEPAPLEVVFQHIQYSTSTGYPWNHIQSVLDPERKMGKRELMSQPYFWDYFWLYYDSLETPEPLWCIFNIALKEEIRPKEKVLEDKTRTICAAPLEHTISCGMEFHNLHEQLMKANLKGNMLYGFSQYYGGWDRFVRQMKEGNYDFCNGWDARQFDSSMRTFILAYFTKWIYRYLPYNVTNERKQRIANLISQVNFAACYLPSGDVVTKPFGNATGWYLTFMINCFTTMFMSAFVRVKSSHDFSWERWIRNQHDAYCGDDYLRSERYNFDMGDFCTITKILGMETTPDELHCQLPEKCVYVSRTSVRYNGMWVSHGNVEKMWSAIYYNFSSKHPGDVIIKLTALRRDMFFHREYFAFISAYILWLFDKVRQNPIYDNDTLIALARLSYEPDAAIEFLHTGRL